MFLKTRRNSLLKQNHLHLAVPGRRQTYQFYHLPSRTRQFHLSTRVDIEGSYFLWHSFARSHQYLIVYLVRIWHFYKKQYTANKELIDIASEIGLKRNPFCRHLTRIIYTHSEHPITHIKMYQSNTIACISRQ